MNGVPRRASSARIGRWTVSRIARRPRRRRGPAAASRRPCRRCSGPTSPSHRRLWSRDAGSATASRPSQIAMTLASRPRSRSSTTSAGPGPRPSRYDGDVLEREPGVVVDRDALAGGEPVLLQHDAVARRRRARPRRRAPPLPRPPRTPGRAPSARRPPRRRRGRTPSTSRSAPRPASARRRGCRRPAARRRRRRRAAPPARSRRAPRRSPAPPRRPPRGSSGSTSGRQRTRDSAPIAALPGATTTSFMPGSPASFQASACSRAPEPTMSVRVGAVRHAHRPRRARAGASAARPARSSASAPARPTRARSARRRAPRRARDVAARVLGQAGERADVVDRLGPAVEPLVDRRRARPSTSADDGQRSTRRPSTS